MEYQFPELSSISKRRKALGITQKRLASMAGISQSLLTKVERGVVVPNYGIARDIFFALSEYEHASEKKLSDVMRRKVIFLKINNTVSDAARLAKRHSVSQFPVIRQGNIIGGVTISMLIDRPKDATIGSLMNEPFPTLNSNTPLEIAKGLLKQYPAIIVMEKGMAGGIVTAEDIL
ncbi:MAG: CBS domain-containing protein [Candidatus Micrarchaeota archaeon]|nr:CBS domain-containing protein [Candidatus Micrarchaeota archaeon]